ncbi:Crp/Fnr family transcriptional regulator [Streptomyces sp. NBC_01264]|uniref:Crp/Fnr family transcriptional regulator n=1 Tax=Streptomyces sp. NBC_01264 TaxID=2903804 RepID=UPI0022516154|nr:Crp/Fnr family transcriptional regulator [Streptomyces sp. NBC_01264]MCX4776510.1 Crp/Fnr family transcriptional regulator [Streptomyces sp. NBC_01264]
MTPRGAGNRRSGAHEPFTADELLLLRGAGRIRVWNRHDRLMGEGGPPDSVVLVVSGLAKITAESDNGYTSVLALRGPGELVGELSCLDGTVRSATVTAIERLEGVVIGAEAFQRVLSSHATLTLAVLRSVIARLRDSDGLRTEHGARTAAAMLAHVLLETAVRHGVDVPDPPGAIEVRMNQQELAGAAGISRESVVRCLRALQGSGLVSTSRGRTLVLDLQGIRRRAQE